MILQHGETIGRMKAGFGSNRNRRYPTRPALPPRHSADGPAARRGSLRPAHAAVERLSGRHTSPDGPAGGMAKVSRLIRSQETATSS
jgi:hypothetical protein